MVTRLAILFIFILMSHGCSASSPTKSATVTIAGETFELELALDNQARALGLMHRTEIPEHGGLLFVFTDSQERSFWMKNCFVDIDLLFLDSRGTVTAVHAMVIEPPRFENESEISYDRRLNHYWSQGRARFAIELKAGSIARLGIRVNDHITLDLPTLKGIAR